MRLITDYATHRVDDDAALVAEGGLRRRRVRHDDSVRQRVQLQCLVEQCVAVGGVECLCVAGAACADSPAAWHTPTHTHLLVRPVHGLHRERQRAQAGLLQQRERELPKKLAGRVVLGCAGRMEVQVCDRGSLVTVRSAWLLCPSLPTARLTHVLVSPGSGAASASTGHTCEVRGSSSHTNEAG
jgi:hypothetical protein